MQIMRTADYIDIQEIGKPIERFNLRRKTDVDTLMDRCKLALELALLNPWAIVESETLQVTEL